MIKKGAAGLYLAPRYFQKLSVKDSFLRKRMGNENEVKLARHFYRKIPLYDI